MKIAFFCERFPLVSEAFIASSAAALIDRGHALSIFALRGHGPACDERQPQVRSHRLEENLRVPAVVGGLAQRAFKAPREMATLVQTRGARAVQAFNPRVFRRSAVNLRALYMAGMLNGNTEFDILHCQFGHLARDVLRLRRAGFISGRVIVHFRGYDITQIPALAGPGFYAPVFAEADWFVANSEFFSRRAISLGAPADRMDIAYSGIDLSNFPYRPPRDWQPRDLLQCMTTGRLVEKKGIIFAIEALAKLKQDGLSFAYDIVGEGPERPRLEAAIARSGLQSAVTLHGAKGHDAIQPMLARAHLFLAPSMTAADSNADAPINTLKEAMATGVPVVSTRYGGIPELVEDGTNGFLAPESDMSGLAQRIRDALDAAPRWPVIAENARQAVDSKFNLSRTTDSLIAIYEKVLSS